MGDERLVLVVDDDAYMRRMLRKRLQASGYRVAEANNGDRALEAARLLLPDVILLDVLMEGMNGLEVCARLKAIPELSDTPILFLSSVGDVPTKVAGFELGAHDYIPKTTDLREVQLRVGAALKAKVKQERLREAAVRLESETQRLLLEAQVDPLTGLANRRALIQEGGRALTEARFTGEPAALFIVDVDHFKHVNDTWGHAFGDEVLRAVGSQVRQLLREEDLWGRLGGEEFVALLPRTGATEALRAAERVRQGIEALIVGEEGVQVTVSIGIAVFPLDGTALDALLEAADHRMYAAKERGRNRVVAGSYMPAFSGPPHQA